jgi:hypothetical protein
MKGFLGVIGMVIIYGCHIFKHTENPAPITPYGLYVDTLPMDAVHRQYLFIDSNGYVHSYFDSINTCSFLKNKIRHEFRQRSKMQMVGDSVHFSFDSSATIQTTQVVFVNDHFETRTFKVFEYDFIQEFHGQVRNDTLFFRVVTNDTLIWNIVYAPVCK